MIGSLRFARRLRTPIAISLALAALILALLVARGPATSQRAQYSWPPPTLAGPSPTRSWVAPLFLARHRAETIDVRLPCALGRTVRDAKADGEIVALSTARDARREGGLAVTRSAQGLPVVIRSGNVELARLAVPSAVGCQLHVEVRGQSWSVLQTGEPPLRGRLAAAPNVYALVSELDVRLAPGLRVTIGPLPQDTRPSAMQTALRLLAALLLGTSVIALLLPVGAPSRRPRKRIRWAAPDVFVGLTLGAWWILAPLHFDDGWVRARQLNSLASGGFSNYYEPLGANLPMATWLEWLQHFAVAGTDALAFHRLPTVLVLAATWIACRVSLTRLIGNEPTRDDPSWWAAAVTFALGGAAFGMTLRPEPAISLLAVVILGLCLRYLDRPALWPILVSTLLGALAVTIHPSGAVAVAPLAVCVPRVVRDARRHVAFGALELAAMIPLGLALAVLLAFLDSDVSSRRTSLKLFRGTDEHDAGIFEEFDRYAALWGPGVSPLRRLVIAVILLSAAAFVGALLTKRRTSERLPTASIVVGLVVLAIAPSKWIWHFGAFVGLSAIAIGFETHRMGRLKLPRVARWYVIGGALILTVWATRRPGYWGPIDTERMVSLYVSRSYAAAALLAFVALLVAAQRHRIRLPHLSALPAVTGAILAVTTLMLALDAATPGAWTPARQVMSAVGGGDRCGVASEMFISAPISLLATSSTRGRQVAVSERREASTSTANAPAGWHALPHGPVGIYVMGLRPVDRVRITWGRRTGGGVERLRTGKADVGQANWGYAPWQFLAEDSFPRRPRGADLIRLDAFGTKGLPSTAVFTEPTPYRQTRLSTVLRRPGTAALVSPFVFEATPCATLPTLAYGVAQPPDLFVDFFPTRSLKEFSLYYGIGDAFDLLRVPQVQSSRLKYIVVYWVRPDPRDAIAMPVEKLLTA